MKKIDRDTGLRSDAAVNRELIRKLLDKSDELVEEGNKLMEKGNKLEKGLVKLAKQAGWEEE